MSLSEAIEIGQMRATAVDGVRSLAFEVRHPEIAYRHVEIRAEVAQGQPLVGEVEPLWNVYAVDRAISTLQAAGLTRRGAILRATAILRVWRRGWHLSQDL